MLIQLIYVSSAKEELSDAELDKILESSARHNAGNEVTGMLLYSCGNFMQVLEGPAEAVDATYERLCADPRHHHIFLLSRDGVSERQFANWRMGFHRITRLDAEAHPAFAPLFANGFDTEQLGAKAGQAMDLLKLFRDTN